MDNKRQKQIVRLLMECVGFALAFTVISKILLMTVFTEAIDLFPLPGHTSLPALFIMGGIVYIPAVASRTLFSRITKSYSDYRYRHLRRPSVAELWRDIWDGEPKD